MMFDIISDQGYVRFFLSLDKHKRFNLAFIFIITIQINYETFEHITLSFPNSLKLLAKRGI